MPLAYSRLWPIGVACLLALLTGCSSSSHKPTADSQSAAVQYCDNYLIYRMCVRDLDQNGDADFMYFADTNEIFMLSPEHNGATFTDYTYHECLQPMDEDLRHASSQLLYINEDSGALAITQLKTRLMLNYTRYLPKINRCMDNHHYADNSDDTFGEEDFEEF